MQSLRAVILAVVLCTGISSVVGQFNFGRCVDSLMSDLRIGREHCAAVRDAMECFVKEANIHKLGLSDSELQAIKDTMNAELVKNGVPACDIDLRIIIEEVRLKELNGTEGTTSKPPTFDTAETFGDCVTAFSHAGITSGGVNCDQTTGYVKCAIRTLGFFDSNPTAQAIQAFEDALTTEFRKQGLYCDLDILAFANELRAQQNGGISTEPSLAPTSPSVTTKTSTAARTTTAAPATTTMVMTTQTLLRTTAASGFRRCVANNPDACANVVNGDYPVCSSECQNGIYITCSNGLLYVRDCPTGWYKSPRGNRMTASLVFDPLSGQCQTKTPACPRPLDLLVEE